MLLYENVRVGESLRLIGVSAKGKTLVKDYGQLWYVGQIRDTTDFTRVRGPWALVAPLNQPLAKVTKAMRWVNLRDDEDFKITR